MDICRDDSRGHTYRSVSPKEEEEEDAGVGLYKREVVWNVVVHNKYK